jgi:hypothetical protein
MTFQTELRLCLERLKEIAVAKIHESGEKPGPLSPDKSDSSDFFILPKMPCLFFLVPSRTGDGIYK